LSPPSTDAPILPLGQTVRAKRAGDAGALAATLERCHAEDAAFVYAAGTEPGAFRIETRTPKELAQRIAQVTAATAVPIETGSANIQPCWTPGRLAEAEHRLGTADGGTGDFAVVRLRIVPRRSGEGNAFESEFAGPPEIDALNAAVARGVARAFAEGVDGEGRIIDTRVVFIDGAFHSKRSTPEGFEQAAVAAIRAACRTAGLRRLEPLMEIEILAERDDVLPVVNDLAPRGGSELRRRLAQKGVAIMAELPLRAFLTYESDLAALTQGRASIIGEPQLARWAEVRRR
jgi:elongation factor G